MNSKKKYRNKLNEIKEKFNSKNKSEKENKKYKESMIAINKNFNKRNYNEVDKILNKLENLLDNETLQAKHNTTPQLRQTTHQLDWDNTGDCANQQLTIEVGDTVEWTWGSGNHNLVSKFGVETLNSGYNFPSFVWSYTFTIVGSTDYECSVHPENMYGTITTTEAAPSSDLALQGILDIDGGLKKAVHVRATADIADLSVYKLQVYINANPTAGSSYTLSGSALAGDDILIAYDGDALDAYMSISTIFDTVFNTGTFPFINGDDSIELLMNDVSVEVFGNPGTDSIGKPWEYKDSWAYKVVDAWTYGGVRCTADGSDTTWESACVYPLAIGQEPCVAPVADVAPLADVIAECEVIALTAPTASYPQSLPIYTIELDTFFTPYTNGTKGTPEWYNNLGLSVYPWYHFLPPLLANNDGDTFTEYVNEPFVLQIKVSDPAYVFSPGSAGSDNRIWLYALYNGTNFGSFNSNTQSYWDKHVNQINNIKAVYFDDSMLGTTSPNFMNGLTKYFTDIGNNDQMFRLAGGENLRVIRFPTGLNPSGQVFPRPHDSYNQGGQTEFFHESRNGNLKILFYGSRIFVNSYGTQGIQGDRGGNENPAKQTWDDESWGENREAGDGSMKDFTVNQIASANVLLNLPHNATDSQITEAEDKIPTATDNCTGSITGTTTTTFPITAQGTTVVTWTYDGVNGNISTQIQNVIINPGEVGIDDLKLLLTHYGSSCSN